MSRLFVEELRSVARGRFAWTAAGVILLAVGALAAVGTQDTWLDGYGIVAYGLVPLAFIPLSAGFVASARCSRFVESVFTAPVRRSDWLAAKIAVLLVLAASYDLALLPMLAVYVAHVGLPPLLREFLWWTPGLLLVSVAVGTLIGVLFIGRSIAAPVGAATGVMLVYLALMPLQELLVAQGNGATRTGHVTLASPAVLLKNALGFALAAPNVPSSTASSWIAFSGIVVAALALAAWVFLRAQGVETWEATRRQRWTIALVSAALVIGPGLVADTNYDTPSPKPNNAPAIRGLFSRAGSSLALVESGRPAPSRCCATILNRDDLMAMPTDEPTARDLLVFLPVETSQPIRDLHLTLSGENGLDVTAANPSMLNSTAPQLERRQYPDASGPADPAGRRISEGWIMRVPVTINPTHPWDIGGDRYPLTVKATYRADGEAAERTFTSRAAIDAQVGPAIYEMSAASSILPLCCFAAALTRWRRTR